MQWRGGLFINPGQAEEGVYKMVSVVGFRAKKQKPICAFEISSVATRAGGELGD